MARKPDPSCQYIVRIHKLNGYLYASTQPVTVDPETGKRTYKRIHWGSLTPDLRFIPNDNYRLAPISERSKLVFPEEWDLSEIEKLSGNRKKGRPSIECQDENRLYGHIWMLEQVAERTGLRDDLLNVFHGDHEKVDDLLTLAMFLIVGDGTFNRLKAWQKIVKAPSTREMTSCNITRLLQSITAQNRMDLISARSRRVKHDELCAVDSTSRSAWGNTLCDIRYGKNKENVPLPQTLEVVVYTLSSHMPVYYRSFPGNMPDSRSLETIVNDLDNAGLRHVTLITDRGYETIKNLELYIQKGQPMIMAAKVGQKMIQDKIDSFEKFDHHPEEMEFDLDSELYFKQYDCEYQIENSKGGIISSKALKLNLYFNPFHRCADLSNLEKEIALEKKSLEECLANRTPLPDDKELKKIYKFFAVNYEPQTRILISYSPLERKIQKKRKNAGFFANFTQGLDMTSMEAHFAYKLRNEQEKYFAMMKGIMGNDRQRNWSEDGKDGSRFVLFIAQIMGSYLNYLRKEEMNEEFGSIMDVLDEMKCIRYVEHPHKAAFITPFVGRQLKIAESCGFEVPKGCTPTYMMKKTTKGKRGRPRKTPLVEVDN